MSSRQLKSVRRTAALLVAVLMSIGLIGYIHQAGTSGQPIAFIEAGAGALHATIQTLHTNVPAGSTV